MQEYLDFATRHPFLVLAAVLLLVMIVAHEVRLLTRRWREIAPAELTRLVNAGALLVDVREAGAFRAGHIAGARNLPLATLADDLAALPEARDRDLVVYCDMGNQSGRAAQLLTGQGYARVANLRGGLSAWQAENLPVAKGLASKAGKGQA